MGLYIKGMKMSTNCSDCPMCYDMMECTVAEPIINFCKEELEKFDFCTERHPRCPLVSVGPHGRLIDADALIRELTLDDEDDNNGASLLMAIFLEVLKAAPTIIPAEEE